MAHDSAERCSADSFSVLRTAKTTAKSFFTEITEREKNVFGSYGMTPVEGNGILLAIVYDISVSESADCIHSILSNVSQLQLCQGRC
ncbi:hypothetical protein LXL04_023629 [Taraxacum kok-saghyz]